MIRASTRLFAVLGSPVHHSLSPQIQNPAFQSAGVDGVYVALGCSPDDLAGLIRGISRGGGGGNVTLPHKEDAARIVDEPSELVLRTGACNTFWSANGVVHGENTDVTGFRGAVESLLCRPPHGLKVLLLGAGGAARGALVGLLDDNVGQVSIWNRTVKRAEQLVADLGDDHTSVIQSEATLSDESFDLIVNSTSVGLRPNEPAPIDLSRVRRPQAVLDLVYRPDETALVREARAQGISAADGGEMLVRQGAEAFALWWNRAAPLEVMLGALADVRRGS